MPVVKLFIEGNLESEVLNPILRGNPVLQRGGSKNSLKPRAFHERRENKVAAGYLRDRDFDSDPPLDLTKPIVDSVDGGLPLGWRWCRHELENYLIEPAVVTHAMGWPLGEVEDAIRVAAGKIREYETARWTIGTVRRALPPHYELRTRPEGLNEIDLPAALDVAAVRSWALNSIDGHRAPMIAVSDPATVQVSFGALAARFDEGFVGDVAQILVWFSGKDILAGMADWLVTQHVPHPGVFRAALRDWIISNPEKTLELLPEWRALINVLRT